MSFDTAFIAFPQLETERLILRELRLDDAPEMFVNFSDVDVTRQLGDEPIHTSVEETRNLLRQLHGWHAQKVGIRWGITLKEGDDKIIGTLGFHRFDHASQKLEIGYELNKAYWGQGIMSEAVLAIMNYGFNMMKALRIEAGTDGINVRSHKLLKRLGFKQEACLRRRVYYRGTYWDEYWFGMLVEEYRELYEK